MYVLLQGGRFCQSVIHCEFSTVSTDFTSCTELLCYISLTLAALRSPVDFTEREIRLLDIEKARVVRRLSCAYGNDKNILS
jgi:hypothetical protein